MASKESYLQITNKTNQNFKITVTETNNYDWDGNSRPDTNFQGVTIASGETNKQREELNKHANSAPYRMTWVFAGGQTVTFRNDQYDAVNGVNPNPREYVLEGDQKDLFTLTQAINGSGPTNEFTVAYKSYTKTLSNWMKSVDGKRRLSSFTLPGSHESAAYENTAGPHKSQSLTIAEQLKIGIRYFDLNAAIVDKKIFVCYGDVIESGDRFTEIFKELTDFLTQNPTETVVVSCHDMKNDGDSFSSIVVDFFKGLGDRVYDGDVIPTLDEVRGKIVVVRRFAYQQPYGLNLADTWPIDGLAITRYTGTDGQRQTIHVQDHRSAPTLEQKYQDVAYLLDLAVDYSGPLFVSHAGVEPFFAELKLETYAGQMNAKLKAYFDAAAAKTNGGVVLMDFVTQDVVESLLKSTLSA